MFTALSSSWHCVAKVHSDHLNECRSAPDDCQLGGQAANLISEFAGRTLLHTGQELKSKSIKNSIACACQCRGQNESVQLLTPNAGFSWQHLVNWPQKRYQYIYDRPELGMDKDWIHPWTGLIELGLDFQETLWTGMGGMTVTPF